jgi:hypothetical protein
VKVVNGVNVRQISCLFEVIEKVITLCVNVRRDVVRDLTSGMAQSDTLVVRSGANPNRTTHFIGLFCPPKPDVVALPRVITNWLLKLDPLFSQISKDG